jgi:hypothetical protein
LKYRKLQFYDWPLMPFASMKINLNY